MLRWIIGHRSLPGQGLVEYALILLLVAIVVIVALALIGPQAESMFSSVYEGLQ